MISITSYAKQKKSSSSNNSGGGGFANAQVYNNGFNPFYLWGQYVDGRDTINGDLISNGTITGNKIVAPQGNIDLIYALSEYVNYISGHTAIFDNLSAQTGDFGDDVHVGGDLDVDNNVSIGGDTVIEGDLNVSGDTRLGDAYTTNITNSDTIKTKNLEVSGLAHFFQLVIDKIKAAGGAILLTPADGFETAYVEEDASGYTLYFHATDGERKIQNMWQANDQAICQTFNAATGTTYNASNTYYWALVTEASEEAVEKTISGETDEYHYIKLSKSTYDGELNPKVGDEIAMLGSRDDTDPQRQSAIYLSAYVSLDQGLTAPCFAEYKGINDFSLSTHRHSYIDATGASFTGDFRIDNNTTIQDYVNSATTEVRNEFIFNEEGLYSRVSKLTNPNILAANGWVDQDDKALYQEDDEEYLFEQEEEQQSLAKGGGQIESEEEEEEYIGIPPIIYLNADTYTFSTYSRVKYENIKYGVEKDNLDQTISAFTGCNSGDTWHDQARMICTFEAPINGYYQFGMKLMDSGYTGDYEWTDPDPVPSGITPDSGDIIPSDIIYTEIDLTMNNNTVLVLNETGRKLIATITTSDNQPFSGSVMYYSSNPSAATVDEQGNITVVGTGTTVFTATIPKQYVMGKHYSGSTDSLTSTVYTDRQQTSITWENNAYKLLNEKLYFNVNTSTASPTVKRDGTDDLLVTSEGDGRYSILATSAGTHTYLAKVNDYSDNGVYYIGSSASAEITTYAEGNFIPITCNEPYRDLSVWEIFYLNPHTDPDIDHYSFTSTNPEVATVNDYGEVTMRSSGTTSIVVSGSPKDINGVLYIPITKTVNFNVYQTQNIYEVESVKNGMFDTGVKLNSGVTFEIKGDFIFSPTTHKAMIITNNSTPPAEIGQHTYTGLTVGMAHNTNTNRYYALAEQVITEVSYSGVPGEADVSYTTKENTVAFNSKTGLQTLKWECSTGKLTYSDSNETKSSTVAAMSYTEESHHTLWVDLSGYDNMKDAFSYLKIWDNGVLIREYVAAMDEYGTPYIWEKVGNILMHETDNSIYVMKNTPVSAITINSSNSIILPPSGTYNLTTSTVPTGRTVSYQSLNQNIATVNSNGVVSGISSGDTSIILSASAFTSGNTLYKTSYKKVDVTVDDET